MDTWEIAVRESVRQTLADYTAATDGFDLSALAACFAADGVLDFTGGKEPLVGAAQIEAGLSAQLGDASRHSRRPTMVRHHVSSVRFSLVQRDRVEVSSYFAVFTDIGVDHWGRYRDALVPCDQGWLFSARKIRVDGFSPNSLMNHAAAPTG